MAAELAGMHAQTLRNYDRLGLVTPHRTTGGGRRYSPRDVALLREVQRLSQDEGVNLAGIKRIIELTNQVEALQQRVAEMSAEIAQLRSARRDLVPVPRTNALVVWKPRHARESDAQTAQTPTSDRARGFRFSGARARYQRCREPRCQELPRPIVYVTFMKGKPASTCAAAVYACLLAPSIRVPSALAIPVPWLLAMSTAVASPGIV